MSRNQGNNFIAARNAVNSVYPLLKSSIGSGRLSNVSQMMVKASNQNDPSAFQPAFQELANIAREQMNNINVLRAIDQHGAAVMRAAGISEARIMAVKGAIATCIKLGTTNNFFLDVAAFWIVLICVCLIILIIVGYFLSKFIPWLCSWMPARTPTPMQTPQWNRLWSAIHSPTIGPAYAIETGQTPSQIYIEA